MIFAGCAAAAVCVALLVLAATPRSRIAARLEIFRPSTAHLLANLRGIELVAPATLRASGVGIAAEQLVAMKIALALLFALLAALVALLVPIGTVFVVAAAYGGFILPSVVVERRAALRRREAERAIASFIEWTHALVSSGRPVDSAIVGLARRGTGAVVLDNVLARVADLYTLGAPLYVSLLRESKESQLASLTSVAERLERARELGQGSIAVLHDLRDELRGAARERLLVSASQVEAKMTLILTLCYLPALALLVIVPLFVTLLAGLFG